MGELHIAATSIVAESCVDGLKVGLKLFVLVRVAADFFSIVFGTHIDPADPRFGIHIDGVTIVAGAYDAEAAAAINRRK